MNHIKKTNIFILLVFILQPLASILFSYLIHTYKIELSLAESLLITQGLLIFVPALIFFGVSGKENPCKKLKFRKLSFIQILLLIAIPFCAMPITILIKIITSLFKISSPIGDVLDTASITYPYVIMLLLIAVVPAIIEELFVRGILFSNYKKINLRTSILISSMLFGMLHFNFDQFFYATVLGVVLALVYEFTENIIAPMIVHFVINGTSVTLLYLLNSLKDSANKLIGNSTPSTDLPITNTNIVSVNITVIMFYTILSVCCFLILIKIFRYFAELTNKLDIFNSLLKGKPQVTVSSLTRNWPICLCVIIFLIYSLLIEFS
jgi:membrane protease YdiL (CAAX protease family)